MNENDYFEMNMEGFEKRITCSHKGRYNTHKINLYHIPNASLCNFRTKQNLTNKNNFLRAYISPKYKNNKEQYKP